MTAVLTLPISLAEQILNEVLVAPGRGWQGYDERHSWTIGHAVDADTGAAFVQIIVEPILATATK